MVVSMFFTLFRWKFNEIPFVGLLGPNGAGKTTLVKAVSGLVPRRSGSIVFDGNSIDRMKAEKIVSLGLIQVAQGRLLFPELTVEENLQMGAYLKRSREKYGVNLKRVEELISKTG